MSIFLVCLTVLKLFSYLRLSGVVDIEALSARLEKKLGKLEKEI
ncbi:hypothetical protein [Okeania sp. SIO1I7]|nr:hypothetical protein [Okeania sp. SIO1I7]